MKRNCEYLFLVLMLKLSVNVCGMIMFHYLPAFFLRKSAVESVCVREREREKEIEEIKTNSVHGTWDLF